MKRYNTPKLFYGKYCYKLIVRSPIANWFRSGDLSVIRETIDGLQQQYKEKKRIHIQTWLRTIDVSLQDLHDAQKIYTAISKQDDFRIRIEGFTIGLFSNDRDWLENLSKSISRSVEEWWEPSIVLQPNTLVMSPTMKDWGYKITLGSDVPAGFFKWFELNQDKIKAGNTLRSNINHGQTYLSGYYFYVKNEKVLNLVTLVLGPSIQRIDKIVVDNKNA